jgi:predicted MFS family arabinose efflux permease
VIEPRSTTPPAWAWDAARTLQLGVLTLARLCINTSLRMVYPFAPALARGLGVPLDAVYALVSFRNLTGLLAPFFIPFSERHGRRPMMVISVVVFALGLLFVARIPTVWALGLALVVSGLAKVVYDPAMQSYLGDAVPYRQRGKAIAVTEFAWAGSFLLGAPAIGWLIERDGWQAPFFWIAVAALISAVLIWRILPSARHGEQRITGLAHAGRTLRQHPVIWAAVAFVILEMTANEILFIVYGDWMEASFGLTLTGLGLATTAIGLAELSGETLAGFTVDRFGKRPVVITSGLLAALMYFLLPFSAGSLSLALGGMVALFLVFEITAVGTVPLLTELVPQARSVVMAMILAAAAVGRSLGSLLGPLIWETGGLRLNTLVAAVLTVIAVLILARWLREGEEVGSDEWQVESG